MIAVSAPAHLTQAQRERWEVVAANLDRPVRAGIQEQLLTSYILAEDQYRVAAGRQATLDDNSALPLLTKSSGGRAAPSPYLAVMNAAARQMRDAASQLNLRGAQRPLGGSEGQDPALDGPGQPAAAYPGDAPPDDDPEDEPGAIGTVTKHELCQILRIAKPTLNAWIDKYGPAFPMVERGTNGRGYHFDPQAVIAFLRGQQEAQTAKRAERDEQLAQLLLPLATPPGANDALSFDDQIKAGRLNDMRLETARKARALVAVVEIEAAQMAFLGSLNRNLQAWGRQFGRTHGWSEALVREVEQSLATLQRTTVSEFVDGGLETEPAADDLQLALG